MHSRCRVASSRAAHDIAIQWGDNLRYRINVDLLTSRFVRGNTVKIGKGSVRQGVNLHPDLHVTCDTYGFVFFRSMYCVLIVLVYPFRTWTRYRRKVPVPGTYCNTATCNLNQGFVDTLFGTRDFSL